MIGAYLRDRTFGSLPHAARAILDLTAEKTGKGFELRVQRDDLTDAWASVKVARGDMPNHVVLYHPEYARHLGYLLAHECGHILRLYGVPENDRRYPATSAVHRRAMVYDIGKDLHRLAAGGLSAEVLGQMGDVWHQGLVRQLTNIPVDMRIERWLYTDFPELRELQVPALQEQMRANRKVVSRAIEEVTPSKVYVASNTMNAAYARYLSRLLGADRWFKDYAGTTFWESGRRLGDGEWESPDTEALPRRNARGELWTMIQAGVSKDELNIVVQNTVRGRNEQDEALMHGVITLPSTDPSGRENDGANNLRMLREFGCGWAEAVPMIIKVPLACVATRWLAWRRGAQVTIPEHEGGRLLQLLVGAARRLLETAPDGFHVLVVTGLLTDKEVRDFKRAVISLCPQGHVVPVVNEMFPRVEGEWGVWTMTDFRTGRQVPQSVIGVVSSSPDIFDIRGMTPEEVMASMKPPAEAAVAHEVAATIDKLGQLA